MFRNELSRLTMLPRRTQIESKVTVKKPENDAETGFRVQGPQQPYERYPLG